MIGFYANLAIFVILESKKCLDTVKANEKFTTEQGMLNQFADAFKLKKKLIKRHCAIVSFYCMGVVFCLIILSYYPPGLLQAEGIILDSQ